MKHHVITFLLGLFLVLNQHLLSQSTHKLYLVTKGMVYINVGIGQSWDNLSDGFDNEKVIEYRSKFIREFHSYGSGNSFDCGIGIDFNTSYSFELNLKTFHGKTIEQGLYYSRLSTEQELHQGTFLSDGIIKKQYTGSAILLTPKLVIEIPKFIQLFSPFFKVGLIIAFPEVSTKITQTQENKTFSTDWLEDGNVSYGYSFDIGIRTKIYEKCELVVNADFTALKYKPSGMTNTDETYPRITYVETKDDVNFYSRLQPSYSFSSIGLHLGLQYHF